LTLRARQRAADHVQQCQHIHKQHFQVMTPVRLFTELQPTHAHTLFLQIRTIIGLTHT
jgi:hypothetical protein